MSPYTGGCACAARAEARIPRAAMLLLLVVVASCDAGESSGGLTLEEALRADWSELEVQVVTAMPDDQPGGRAIVFLHGYGSKGADSPVMSEAVEGSVQAAAA